MDGHGALLYLQRHELGDRDAILNDPGGQNARLSTDKVKDIERADLRVCRASRQRSEVYRRRSIWDVDCDVAFPCATQNELTGRDAQALIKNAVFVVAEGANMPCTSEAVRLFRDAGVIFAPGKAANAGGVATSALEMQQNASRDR